MDKSLKRRSTPQRRVVLEELQKLTSHPTAVELYEIVRRRLPNISLGTVYRNLELLAKTGVIQKLEFGGSEARFDGNASDHHHIQCMECGRVDDLHGLPDTLPISVSEEAGDYKILGHRLVFYGICGRCRAAGAENELN